LEIEDGRAYFAEYGAQGGGDISSLIGADLLAEIPADSPPLEPGTMIRAWRI
jgi:molybdopterin biosynthesis enzyme